MTRGRVVLAALSLSLLGSGSGLEAGKTVWPALPALKAPAPAPWRVPDSQLLAEVAMAEDPSAGAAVMWTVVNRARAARTSLMTEVLRPGAYGTRKGGTWRPSWWPGRAWQAPADLRALVRLRRTARDVLAGRLADPTGGARHFHRVGTWTPPWAPEPAVWRVYGSHAFYRTK